MSELGTTAQAILEMMPALINRLDFLEGLLKDVPEVSSPPVDGEEAE